MPVVFLPHKQGFQIFAAFEKDIYLTWITKFGPGTPEAHTLSSTINVVVSGNAENPLLRHSRRDLKILKEASCQLIFLRLSRKDGIASHEYKIQLVS